MTTEPAARRGQKAPVLFTVLEIAELMRVSKDSVYALISRGELNPTEVGHGRAKTRISEDEYCAYVRAHTRKAAS